jgi:predicted nucleic acid-binding protein
MAILLDSVILIDHLNGIRPATTFLRTVQDACISVITRAEVLSGKMSPGTRDAVVLLNLYPTLSIGPQIADTAADLRRKFGWRLPDAFQAALATVHKLKLATRNTRDFPSEKHSFVVVPYTI